MSRRANPTARTLSLLRDEGWSAELVEQKIRIPGGRMFKRDLFGCIDVVACHKRAGETLGVQCTTCDHHAHRRTKALAEPRLRTWLLAGNRFEVWSWRKVGRLWQVRQEVIRLEHFLDGEPQPRPRRTRVKPARQEALL